MRVQGPDEPVVRGVEHGVRDGRGGHFEQTRVREPDHGVLPGGGRDAARGSVAGSDHGRDRGHPDGAVGLEGVHDPREERSQRDVRGDRDLRPEGLLRSRWRV